MKIVFDENDYRTIALEIASTQGPVYGFSICGYDFYAVAHKQVDEITETGGTIVSDAKVSLISIQAEGDDDNEVCIEYDANEIESLAVKYLKH